MSRYRPPPLKSSPYITRAGYDRLRAEYEQLWRRRRPEVVKALAAAAAEGDRSENAEYIYRKKELREIDRRVGYLQKRLAEFKLVERPPADRGRVFFGAWVEVDDGRIRRVHHIVGADEIGFGDDAVSVDSPLARALIKHAAGERVRVELPTQALELEILRVWYD
ncbi:MAG: transcription elongation factor GreB [Gammaproteobacteria bacterium]|nr:transcription elongation factor GreB [Gammaproteobacteria bacterium]